MPVPIRHALKSLSENRRGLSQFCAVFGAGHRPQVGRDCPLLRGGFRIGTKPNTNDSARRTCLFVCGLLLSLGLQGPGARAAAPLVPRGQPPNAESSSALGACWCPNNYAPKPLPEAPCIPACAGPDDFQPKPLPGAPCWASPCYPDRFNPKPLICAPTLWEPWYVCGAAEPSVPQQQSPQQPQRDARRVRNRRF